MSISENIFRIMNERHISQKEFSQLIGVPESTISDWKRKGKTPNADKIMDICRSLEVTPYDILLDEHDRLEYITVEGETELGRLVLDYDSLNSHQKERLKGYLDGLLGHQMSS